MNGFSNKWIFVGSLGAVFLITLVFSYGPGYGGTLFTLLRGNINISPEVSPSHSVTPVVTELVTPKKIVTPKNVTTVTSMSPIPSPNSLYTGTITTPLVTNPVLPSQIPSSPIVSSSPAVTPSPTPHPQSVLSVTPTPTLTPTPAPSQSAKININIAGLSELENIKGVGPVIAQRIIDYRLANGPFQKIDDIIGVKGIGDATFQKMKEQITVGP